MKKPIFNKSGAGVITNRDLLIFLRSRSENLGFVDSLKMCYRPFVCPILPLLSIVEKGDYVADIGCGLGQFSLLLSNFSEPRFILGIDIDEELVLRTKERYNKNTEVPGLFLQFDGVNFPDQISNADVIFLIDVFHHVPAQQQGLFIHNLLSRIKKGSKLVVKDIDKHSIFVYFNKLHDLIFSRQIGNEVSCDKMILLLSRQDTSIVSVNKERKQFFPHYTVIIEKVA